MTVRQRAKRRLEGCLLAFSGISQWVGDDAAAIFDVVARGVQMPMQPHLRMGQQVVQRIAKSGGARSLSVAGVDAPQAGCKVSYHYGDAVKRLVQCAA